MLAEKNNNASLVNEQQLFHGTRPESLEPIMNEGFTWTRAGSAVGHAYGKGVYFGTNPATSAGYMKTNSMFIVKVLVGQSVQGNSAVVKPQPPYDSTSGPNMFVIYHEFAMYPEYLVYF
jgi:hypothetical protein